MQFGCKHTQEAPTLIIRFRDCRGNNRPFQRDVAHVHGGRDEKSAVLIGRFEGVHGLAYFSGAIHPRQEERASLPEGDAFAIRVCIAIQLDIPVEERLYTLQELMNADEIIVTSSLTLFTRVYEIDGCKVGGHDLSMYQRLHNAYAERFLRETEYDA